MDAEQPIPTAFEALHHVDADTGRILRILASPRCRYLLADLRASETPMILDDAAIDVGAWELDCDPETFPDGTFQPIFTSLYHDYAPRMADAGLVAFDADELTVDITDTGEAVSSALGLRGLE